VTGTFKANNPYNSFLLLVYGILLKLPMFLHPKIPQEQLIDGFLYKALLKWLQPVAGSFPLIYAFIAFILLYTQAVSFNKLVNDLRLMQKPNYLAGMSYLLVTSLFTVWNVLSAPLIINTLLIWVWARMSGLNNDASPKSTYLILVLPLASVLFSISLPLHLRRWLYSGWLLSARLNFQNG